MPPLPEATDHGIHSESGTSCHGNQAQSSGCKFRKASRRKIPHTALQLPSWLD